MYIPDYLFYEPQRIDEQLTTQYTGAINVPVALQGDTRCWIKQDITSLKEKKTLVISDFRLGQLSDEESAKLTNLIQQLILEGFTIHLWQQQGLVELDLTNAGCLLLKQTRNDCTPVHRSVITDQLTKKAASHAPVPVEGIQILTLSELNELQNETAKSKAVDDNDIRQSRFLIEEIKKVLPGIQLESEKTEKFEDAVEYDDNADELSSNDTLDLSMQWNIDFQSEERQQTIKGMPNLKKIIMPTQPTGCPEQLMQLLHGPQHLDYAPQVNIWYPLQYVRLSEDETRLLLNNPNNVNLLEPPIDISITSESLTSTEVIQALNKVPFPNLSIGGAVAQSTTANEPPNYHLRHIEGNLNPGLIDIARSAPLLQELRIHNEVNTFNPFSLSNLSALSFIANNFDVLQSLHSFAPHLQKLSIHLNEYLKLPLFSDENKPHTLNSLKEVSLNVMNPINKTIDPQMLISIGTLAPNVKVLDLNYSIYDGIQFCLNHEICAAFPSIRQLKLTSLDTQSDSLHQILNHFSKLEHLTIDRPIQGGKFFEESPLPRKLALKTLNLNTKDKNIGPQLAAVVERSLDLEELNLENFQCCGMLLRNLFKNNVKLNHLKKVNLKNSNLTDADFQLLKAIAPHLVSIDISNTPMALAKPHDESIKIINNPTPSYSSNSIGGDSESFGNNEQEDSHTVNSDTTPYKDIFNINEIFKSNLGYKPPPNYYRISPFNATDPNNPFKLINIGDPELEPYHAYQYGKEAILTENARKEGTVYEAKYDMILTNQFKALPSLSPDERLNALNVKGLEQDDIEIHYSKRDNLYYIRKTTKGPASAKIHFSLESSSMKPDPLANFDRTCSDQKVNELLSYIREFGEGALYTGWRRPNNRQLLDLMYEQKLGRCEQRSAVFKDYATRLFPNIPVRVICNDAHVFVEVKHNDEWIQCCLGGYQATLNITPFNEEEEPSLQSESLESLSEETAKDNKLLVTSLDKRFVTWDTTLSPEKSLDGVALSALSATTIDSATGQHVGQNVLMNCENDADVVAVNLHLQSIAKKTNRPVYVINHPDQIVCASQWLKRGNDNTGTPMKGPGGPLHDFLTHPYAEDEKPVLIVNWNAFSADQLVRFNSLIDAKRLADGTPLPSNMVVVGLYNNQKPDAYKGSDFHSRNPVKLSVRSDIVKDAPDYSVNVPLATIKEGVHDIELYNANNWKDILLGRWTIEAGQLRFIEGELITALKQNKAVHLRNAPWHNPAFKQFMEEARIHGSIKTTGATHPIPLSFWDSLTQSEGYEWQALTDKLNFETSPNIFNKALILNAGNFNQFMPHYHIANGMADAAPSQFAQYQNKTLPLLITSNLTVQSWHQLLKEAKKWNIKLQVGIANDLEIPSSLAKAVNVNYLEKSIQPQQSVQLISSSDVSYTLSNIKSAIFPKPLVIDVSELDHPDLIYQVKANVAEKGLTFEERYSKVWKKLQKGETVVLKGHFKDELMNALLPLCTQEGLMINGKIQPIKGKLILVSDQPFTKALASNVDKPSLQDKLDWIFAQNITLPSSLRTELLAKAPKEMSLAQLEAVIQQYDPDKPLNLDLNEGILKLTSGRVTHLPIDLSEQNVKSVSAQFVTSRLQSMRTILQRAPFTFVGGKTGVGKSTFMQRYLTKENGFTLYNEMKELENWASDKTPGLIKTLFIDEANISNNDYTIFEGLYENPPFVLINGKIITLTPEHKVVLAGNPMSYGGERHLPTLLAQHGNACTFDVIPNEYIYLEILKPVFDAAGILDEQTQHYSRAILETYQAICAFDDNTVLISPRELKMMAMMIVNSQNREKDFTNIIHTVAKQCLPDDKKAAFEQWFTAKYHLHAIQAKDLLEKTPNASGKPFTLTASRIPIYDTLQRLLKVRQTAITSPHKALQMPGLGGMLLEGEPGTGKSHFVFDALIKEGYQQIPLANAEKLETIPEKGFYVIPASLSFAEKRKILLTAFDQGLPVIIDEINSGPAMEQLLNALLMGENPETKKPPLRPGFLLLATQNPISMAGRQATSLALARRLLFYEFNAYTGEEMKQILSKGFPSVPKETLDKYIEKHLLAVSFAKANHLEPAPVFRDLYHLVDLKAKGLSQKVVKQEAYHSAPATIEKPSSRAPVISPLLQSKKITVEDLAQALTLAYRSLSDPKTTQLELKADELDLEKLTAIIEELKGDIALKELKIGGALSKDGKEKLERACRVKGISLNVSLHTIKNKA